MTTPGCTVFCTHTVAHPVGAHCTRLRSAQCTCTHTAPHAPRGCAQPRLHTPLCTRENSAVHARPSANRRVSARMGNCNCVRTEQSYPDRVWTAREVAGTAATLGCTVFCTHTVARFRPPEKWSPRGSNPGVCTCVQRCWCTRCACVYTPPKS